VNDIGSKGRLILLPTDDQKLCRKPGRQNFSGFSIKSSPVYRIKLSGNHNPFQLSRNLERAEALSEKIRIANQVSLEDEIEKQFQIEIVRSEYVSVLFIAGNYLCQEICKKYYNVVILIEIP